MNMFFPLAVDTGDPVTRIVIAAVMGGAVLCFMICMWLINTDRRSDLEWTVSRPPRLTDKPLSGAYRTAIGRNPRGGVLVSRADVAHFMVGCLATKQWSRKRVIVSA